MNISVADPADRLAAAERDLEAAEASIPDLNEAVDRARERYAIDGQRSELTRKQKLLAAGYDRVENLRAAIRVASKAVAAEQERDQRARWRAENEERARQLTRRREAWGELAGLIDDFLPQLISIGDEIGRLPDSPYRPTPAPRTRAEWWQSVVDGLAFLARAGHEAKETTDE